LQGLGRRLPPRAWRRAPPAQSCGCRGPQSWAAGRGTHPPCRRACC
jgi:hypothetical protein